jgi:hypothetical protein
VLLAGDDEYVFASGSNLRIYNDVTSMTHFVSPQISNCVAISQVVLSSNREMLAVVVHESNNDPTGGMGTSVTTMNPTTGDKVVTETQWVKGKTACVHLFDMKAQLAHSPKKPKIIMFRPDEKTWQDSWPTLRFTSVAISNDCAVLAVSTNIAELGTLVYDAVTGALIVKMATTSLIKQLSFYPDDSSKLCAVGAANTIQMWRISGNKNAYLSPAHGLASVPHNDYTCISWLTKAPEDTEQRVLVGSSLGYVALIQGIDQIQPLTWAFGAPSGYVFCSIYVLPSFFPSRPVPSRAGAGGAGGALMGPYPEHVGKEGRKDYTKEGLYEGLYEGRKDYMKDYTKEGRTI